MLFKSFFSWSWFVASLFHDYWIPFLTVLGVFEVDAMVLEEAQGSEVVRFVNIKQPTLSSACTTLASPKIGGASTMGKKNRVFLAIVFGLHYLCGLELKPLINLLFAIGY